MTTLEEHDALVAGVREELVNLWSDLENAVHMADGVWTGQCERLKDRIEALSDLVGPASWRDISIPFLLSRTYRQVCAEIGYPMWVPAGELARLRARYGKEIEA